MPTITKLAKANPQSTSIRTTVPNAVVQQLNLEVGDRLDWDIRSEDGKKYVIVSKVEESKGRITLKKPGELPNEG